MLWLWPEIGAVGERGDSDWGGGEALEDLLLAWPLGMVSPVGAELQGLNLPLQRLCQPCAGSYRLVSSQLGFLTRAFGVLHL